LGLRPLGPSLSDTAESELLDRHGAVWGLGRRPAAPAHGAVITAGTKLRRSDDPRFSPDAPVTLEGGVGTGQVTAFSGGNSATGQGLAGVAPLLDLTSATVGTGGLASGLEVEDDTACGPDQPPKRQERGKRGASTDPHGDDASKKIEGKKRHLLVDTLGLILPAVVTPDPATS
jgi:Baseplate J-like protein